MYLVVYYWSVIGSDFGMQASFECGLKSIICPHSLLTLLHTCQDYCISWGG